MKSCSPQGSTAATKLDCSILKILLVCLELSWSEVGVNRIFLVLAELDAGIVKIILLLLLALSLYTLDRPET